MKKYITILAWVFLSSALTAQNYGNEWINFDQQYYKVSVAEDGIYRITYADLLSAGFPLTTTDPRRLRLFYRGEEQAILVEGEGDAVFNTTDFIEFYGKRNDGTLDADLYRPSTAQPHAFYNIFSDTSAYFLTFGLTPGDGKRMATVGENNVGALPAEITHNEDIISLNLEDYSLGQGFATDEVIRFTHFDQGEGWTSNAIQENQQSDFSIAGIINEEQAVANPTLEVLLVGRDNLAHNVEIFVGPGDGSLRSLGTTQFFNFETDRFTSVLDWSDVNSTDGSLVVRVAALGVSGGNDLISTSYVRVRFPQNFSTSSESKVFNLGVNPGNESFLEINEVLDNTGIYDITDPDNVAQVRFQLNSGTASFVLGGTSIERKLYVNSEGEFGTPVVRRVDFRDITPANHDYVIISHKLLMQPAGSIDNPVQAYAEYRASDAGGSFDTLVVDIDQLYNQFNFGETSPRAIYEFMRFMIDEGDPRYLFLVGKGLSPDVDFHRNLTGFFTVTKFGQTFQVRDLVPPAGFPGSDMVFTAGLDGTEFEPAVPVGRLPAKSSSEVVAYLDKVRETEALPFDDLWRKRVLHLSGGLRESELPRFLGYMNGFASVAEDDFLGGDVTTIQKRLSGPIELINIAEELNEGLNLVTFYGHSSPGVTDIDIGFVTDPVQGYNNAGRYPMFLINGCNAGQFFRPDVLFGEDWIVAPGRGAIGFIAHSFFGFENTLRKYSDTFYSVAYGDSIFVSRPIGDVQKETVIEYMSTSSSSPVNITQAQQMMLLGDPAVQLFGPVTPDYEISEENVFLDSFNDEPVTSLADSFAVKMITRNFGRTSNDSLRVNVSRTLGNGSVLQYDSIFSPVLFRDTLVMVIRRGNENGFGNNRFVVTLDGLNEIDELDENNNSASIDAFIQSFGTRNLFPVNYSIVNAQPVNLLAQSTDLLQDARDFLFEIDTTASFNSPFRMTNTLNAELLANWQTSLLPNIPVNDSVVYFWRTRFAQPQPGENTDWVTSSFTYINSGPEGWSQGVFDQVVDNQLFGLQSNPANRKFEFLRIPLDIGVLTLGADNELLPNGGDPGSEDSLLNISLTLNDVQYIIDNGFSCLNNTMNFVAFERTTSNPYLGVFFPFTDRRSCGRIPQVINSFGQSIMATTSPAGFLVTYVDNVNEGDSVLLFSIGDPGFSTWSATVKTKLEELGIATSTIEGLQDGEPVIIMAQKGAPVGSATVIRTTEVPAREQQLTFDTRITGVTPNGAILSTLIGPASSWQTLSQSVTASESPVTDVFSFDVIGITLEGAENVLFPGVTSVNTDLSSINPDTYPFLRLRVNLSDPDNLTPAQLSRWTVLYAGVPEGILLPFDKENLSETRQEGQDYAREFGFWNIGERNFPDSLAVRSTVFNVDRRQLSPSERNIASPLPGDTTRFTVEVNTIGKAGENDLNVFVNPSITPEVYYDNNVIDLPRLLTVQADNINPVIDVVFDGEYILDGDIVSPSPMISIKLKDENQFILKTDTAGVNLFLRFPCEGCTFERVALSSENVQWTPATEDRDFSVEFRPGRLEDGVYTFRVEADDASGNSSGVEPYLVNFEVINESSITNFYPYPNPFSTNTRFVFTLTGSEIPDQVKIQIMTVSGKIVREITQDELGPIRIGNNISDFSWNGKDEFGDQLANGVYLYKVIVKQNGQNLNHRGTSADKAFKNGFGKLYLLR